MSNFEIIKLASLDDKRRAEIMPKLDALFFQASNTHDFSSEDEKAVFRETWLGRYISHYPDYFYVALGDGGELLGYLAGCLDNPVETPHFNDIEYFDLFKNECARYPAQLHINISSQARGSGVGRTLVDVYTTQCTEYGVTGCHVVTRAGADNIGFYEACDFIEIKRAHWQARDRTLLFFGKDTAMQMGKPTNRLICDV